LDIFFFLVGLVLLIFTCGGSHTALFSVWQVAGFTWALICFATFKILLVITIDDFDSGKTPVVPYYGIFLPLILGELLMMLFGISLRLAKNNDAAEQRQIERQKHKFTAVSEIHERQPLIGPEKGSTHGTAEP